MFSKLFIFITCLLLLVAFNNTVLAEITCPTGELCNPLGKTKSIQDLIKAIVDWLIIIAGPIAVGMIIWGGVKMVIAAGDPKGFEEGKNIILYAVIGYAIILVGWGIQNIIESILKSDS